MTLQILYRLLKCRNTKALLLQICVLAGIFLALQLRWKNKKETRDKVRIALKQDFCAWDTFPWLEKVQEARKNRLSKSCDRLKSTAKYQNKTQTSVDFLVDDEHKLLVCPILLSGDTFWESVILISTGKVAENNPLKMLEPNNVKFPQLRTDALKVNDEKLKLYKKVIFTEDPLSRLYSTYIEMFANFNDAYWKYGRIAIRKFRENPSEKSLQYGHDITFEEFLRYVVYHFENSNEIEHYWTSIMDVCHPCNIDYDIIGHMETFDVDSKYALCTSGIANMMELFSGFETDIKKKNIRRMTLEAYERKHALESVFTNEEFLTRHIWNICMHEYMITPINIENISINATALEASALLEQHSSFDFSNKRISQTQSKGPYKEIPNDLLQNLQNFMSMIMKCLGIKERMRTDNQSWKKIHNECHTIFDVAEKNSVTSFEVIRYPMPVMDQTTLNQDWLNSMMEVSVFESIKQFVDIHCLIFSHSMKVWDQIANEHFDLIIADEAMFSARLVSASLNIPLITYINWGPMSGEVGYVQRFNLAYVPAFMTAVTDTMSFTERISNIWEYFHLQIAMSGIYEKLIVICREYGYGNACDNIQDSPKTVSLVFINRNDALHYPAPFMPHVISIEGFFIDKPKPLSQHYSDIIQQAGNNGIIVVSFGSMFRRLWPELSTIFAKAFAAMPQTVIWSYEGPTPEGLGNNTIVNKWIPQEDLMNHPAAKLFVTQCGAASTFQAMNNALPTIGIPFFWDQPYNCRLLSDRIKSGKTVSLKAITSEKLQHAMEDVIKDRTYKENADNAAAIYHDQPIPPRDKVIYWAEYVIRHKGAPHLRSQAANELNFFQYFLLDIIGMVCVMCIIVGIIVILMIKKTISFFTNLGKSKLD